MVFSTQHRLYNYYRWVILEHSHDPIKRAHITRHPLKQGSIEGNTLKVSMDLNIEGRQDSLIAAVWDSDSAFGLDQLLRTIPSLPQPQLPHFVQ